MTPSITLLGPQRRPTLDRVLSSLGVDGPVAVVNAGWQERESDDAELLALAGARAVNLRLFARWMDVLHADPEYAAAEREHRLVLDELQQLYLIRLDNALQAVSAIVTRRGAHENTRAMALEDALTAVRLLDATHLARVRGLHDTFYVGALVAVGAEGQLAFIGGPEVLALQRASERQVAAVEDQALIG